MNYTNLKHLSDEEIRYLITKYRQFIKNLTNEYKKRIRYKGKYDTDDLYEIRTRAENLLTIIGYTEDHIYKVEAISLIGKFCNEFEWLKKHSKFSNDLLATVIVGEILEHYRVNYDLQHLLGIYDISIEKYMDLGSKVEPWSEKHYWVN